MENALIPLLTAEVQSEAVQLCNARDLHAALQVGRVFAAWISGRIEEYGFSEGIDFLVIDFPKSENQKKAQRIKLWNLIDGA